MNYAIRNRDQHLAKDGTPNVSSRSTAVVYAAS